MNADKPWDVCVVGTGIIGSATAFMLVSTGCKRVLAIEQLWMQSAFNIKLVWDDTSCSFSCFDFKFPLPHTRGSSHGQTRVIRYSYGQKIYSRMMPECYEQWSNLEKITGEKLLEKCGLLSIDTSPLQAAKELRDNLEELGIKSKLLKSDEFKAAYPMLDYPEGSGAIYEFDGGVLMANKCGQSLRDLFVKYGGTLIDGERVDVITPGRILTIKTSKAEYRAKKVVITAGPWTSMLMEPLGLNLPLQPFSINVCYWKTKDPRYKASEGFPTFADIGNSGSKKCAVYGLPCIEYPDMMKICLHHGNEVNPDSRDLNLKLRKDVEELGEYIANHFKNVERKPCIVETCMYTTTPDDDFIIDLHPRYPNIVIGAGFSGHGFKLAPVIGKLLAELATEITPTYDLKPFSIKRFQTPSSLL